MYKKENDPFIKAYYDFKESVDFTKSGILPDLDNMIGYLLMGIPPVPADDDPSNDAVFEAIDQRVAILKAVFAELNRVASDEFLDRGLTLYDEAAKKAKVLLRETINPDQ